MTVDDIPFESDCHGRLAEFEASSGEWLRVREAGTKFLVTRFGRDKAQIGEPAEMTKKALGALL